MKKKKLLVTGSTFPRWNGDTEPRFVLDLSVALTEYYDVTVLVPAAPNAKETEIMEGVNVERYHYFPIHKWETLCYPGAIVPRIKEKKARALLVPFLFVSLFFNLLKRMKYYDVVHAHWLIPQGIIQSFFKKPYIVTGHGADVTSLNVSVIKKLKEKCMKNASGITAVSSHLKSEMEKLGGKNIVIQPMGCHTDKFSAKYCKDNYFNQNGKKVILFVGRLAEKKGVQYLIEAMENIDAKLVIVGKGPLEDALKKQAEKYKEKILFMGPKTHEELKIIYASADLFVAPSVTAKDGDVEGFGLVILEAMASGLPVVASKSGGIVDLIEDGVNGILAEERNSKDLADKINYLINNREKYEELVTQTRITAEKYDYKIIAQKYAQIIEKAVNDGRITK